MRDVIVIGSGGGGAVVAKELAQQGLDVLLLEAGGHPQDTEQEWSHYESAATGILRWGPADRTKPGWTRENAQVSSPFQAAGVGGTTTQYFANSPRAMPGAFAGYRGHDKHRYDVNYLFPFSYEELKPYYRWVEKTLPVQTAAMGTKEEVFLNACESLGLYFQKGKDITCDGFRSQENAILQPQGSAGRTDNPDWLQFPFARGCTFCGHCFQGCYLPLKAPRNLKAKRSTYNSYVPMALTADLWSHCGKAATLISDAFATQILTEGSGSSLEVVGVRFRIGATGEFHEETAKVVVIACGAVETPRLWLNSGLPDFNEWVGKGLTTHATEMVMGIMPFDAGNSSGPASAARIDFPGRGSLEPFGSPPGGQSAFTFLGSAGGFSGYNDDDNKKDPSKADRYGRLVGPDLKEAMSDVDRLMNIVILTDDDVDPSNRVATSINYPPDEHGAVPLIEYKTLTPRTVANREYLTKQAVKVLRAAGATEVIRAKAPPTMIHMHSTMRMGMDESNSVLDENCESRAVAGLYIADNSALANSIGGPNPTLTTQALATRTAEKIFQKYFGGQEWVKFSAPLSSIDSAVTFACHKRGIN